jgi:hypothetical protein
VSYAHPDCEGQKGVRTRKGLSQGRKSLLWHSSLIFQLLPGNILRKLLVSKGYIRQITQERERLKIKNKPVIPIL